MIKGGQVDCKEVVLCLSQKVAKNGQILSMFVPKKWLFSLLLQPHQGWLVKSKNWLMSKICQPLSLVSGFFGLIGLAFCTVISWTQREVANLVPNLGFLGYSLSLFWLFVVACKNKGNNTRPV